MEIALDSNCTLRSPDLHDGYVVGLELLDKGMLRVRLRDVRDQSFNMILTGLRRLKCSEFLEGNIIFDVTIVCGIQPDMRAIRSLMGELHPDVGSPHRENHALVLERCAREVAEGKTTIVTIEPSYGCHLIALCEAVQIEVA